MFRDVHTHRAAVDLAAAGGVEAASAVLSAISGLNIPQGWPGAFALAALGLARIITAMTPGWIAWLGRHRATGEQKPAENPPVSNQP